MSLLPVLGDALSSFPRRLRPYNNITPFTYQDGLTYLEVLESLREWLSKGLIGHLNEEITTLIEEYDKATDALKAAMVEYTLQIAADREAFEETIAEDREAFAALMQQRQNAFEDEIAAARDRIETAVSAMEQAAARAEAAEDSAEQWAANTKELQDVSVSTLVNEKSSLTRGALGNIRQSYNLLDSDAVGDGVTDDTAAIQAFIDAVPSNAHIVGQVGKVYLYSKLVIKDKSNILLDGNGASIKLKAVDSVNRADAFGLQGVLDGIEIRNWNIVGTGVVEHRHCGIRVSGAATVKNLVVKNNTIRNVTIGISASADTAGATILGVDISNNQVQNVTGIESGTGYGIHVAVAGAGATGIVIAENRVISAQRHSIYCAKGRGAVIANNTILDHRDASKDSSIRPAITVARCSEVSIVGNSVIRPAGGALLLGPKIDGEINAGAYTVTGNTFADPQDGAALLYVGTQGPAAEGVPYGCTITDNAFTSLRAVSLVVIWNGNGVKLDNNYVQIRAAGACSAFVVSPQGVTGNDYLDNLSISDNQFDLDAANSTGKVGIRLSPGFGLLTTKTKFRGNQLLAGAIMFATSEAFTNPNISISDQAPTGVAFAAGTSPKPFEVSSSVQTAAPANGTAPALPANPNGYFELAINGVVRKIAYY
jgi:hypothetical protein